MRFAEARGEPGAEDLELAMLARQAELDAVPVEPSGLVPLIRRDRREAQLADVPGHLGIIVVREQRDMAEHVVEAVGRLEIVELVARADEIADRKNALRKHREEDLVGHQPRHRYRAPAGARRQDRVQPLDVGNAGMREPEQVDPVEEGGNDARSQQFDLPREQQVPDRMIFVGERFPVLRDDIIGPKLPLPLRGGERIEVRGLRPGRLIAATESPLPALSTPGRRYRVCSLVEHSLVLLLRQQKTRRAETGRAEVGRLS